MARTGINSLNAGAPDLRLTGNKMAGGPYNLGSDRKNAAAVWQNMDEGDKSIYNFNFEFFLQSGDWMDQIQGSLQTGDRRMASAEEAPAGYDEYAISEKAKQRIPDPPEWFNKEIEMAYGGTARPTYTQSRKERMAQGGIARLGYRGGKIIEGHPHNLAYITPGEAKTLQNLGGKKVMTPEGIPAYPPWDDPGASPGTSHTANQPSGNGGGGGWQNYAIPAAPAPAPAAPVHDFDTNYATVSPAQSVAMVGDTSLAGSSQDYAQAVVDAGMLSDPADRVVDTGITLDTGDATAMEEFYRVNPVLPPVEDYDDTVGQQEQDLAYMVNKGLLQEKFDSEGNPTGEFEPGRNVRDPDTLEIVPRESIVTPPTDDRTGEGEGITSVPTDNVPVEDTGLTAEENALLAAAYGYGTGVPTEFQEAPYQFADRGDERDLVDPRMKRTLAENIELMTDPRTRSAVGGRIGYDKGGIAGIRQPFLFGGIGKVFKKATKAVKKVAKSPVGKAALLAAGAYYSPQIASYLGGTRKFAPTSFMGQLTGGNRLAALRTLLPGGTRAFPGVPLSTEEKKLAKQLKDAITKVKIAPTEENLKAYEQIKKISEIGKITDPAKTARGLTTSDMLALAGITGTMAGTAKYVAANQDDDQEEMNKFLARQEALTEPWRMEYGRKVPTEFQPLPYEFAAKGGRIGYANGSNDDEDYVSPREAALSAMYGLRKKAQEGGLMDLGGMEKDYREEGGFVPIGGQEKADDVPARLSKNEFVFTADAVRAAGGGDIDKGAEIMENLMENLEAGGKVSEESQGLEGARNMFANAQQLEKRII
jgi:hypothetical protein